VNKNDTSVVILAGGNSQRLDIPKPFLPFDSDTTFLEKIVNEYSAFGCEEIIAVLNKKFFSKEFFNKLQDILNVNFVSNEHPDLGRFYSLKLGINAMQNNSFCFIQNVDNPFIDSALLNELYKSRIDEGFAVPVYKGKRGHPVIIGNQIITRIKSEKDDTLNIRNLLNEYKAIEIETNNDKVLANINTANDYRNYFGNSSYPPQAK